MIGVIMEIIIKIASDFSETPGARYKKDGDFSGEEFYEKILKSKFEEALNSSIKLTVNLDGTHGYATSFLDEAFGRLARDFGKKIVLNNLMFISNEEPYLIEEIVNEYITKNGN